MALHQFDYIFAVGMIFAFLDAFCIGANDAANSLATAVASRSLTYPQAVFLGAAMEFLGAVLAGARVSDTIRNGIIDVDKFIDQPGALMMTMASALVGSSIWLTIATKIGAPVSTTHSIVGAVIGAGIAAIGAENVHWGWDGFAQIVASWFIAPGIAGIAAAILFLLTKHLVMERKNSLQKGFIAIPFFFALTVGVLVMLICWKGAKNLGLDDLSTGQILGAIFGAAAGIVVIYGVFMYPYLYRKLFMEDWRVRIWHLPLGPLLWTWGEVPPMPEGMKRKVVVDYYQGKRNLEEEEEYQREQQVFSNSVEDYDTRSPTIVPNTYKGIEEDIQEQQLPLSALPNDSDPEKPIASVAEVPSKPQKKELGDYTKKDFKNPKNWPRIFWLAFTHGIRVDVISSQRESTRLGRNIEDMHSKVKKYDNKTEHLFSLAQIATALVASFSHGANDISNSVSPLATIYLVWNSNTTSSEADVPIWCLVYTASALAIGLYFYGYNLMKNLGNKMTLQSPCRGFCTELGAAITVVMATQLALPVSTTQCIVGAIVAVGLCNGTYKTVNWRMVAWSYGGWIFTLPCAGLMAGLLNAFVLYAPNLHEQYVMS